MSDSLDGRNPRIDSARALAILGVVAVHSSQAISWEIPAPLAAVAGTGRYGVQLFFVISGFLIASIYDYGRPWNAREFSVRRIGRVYPLYFIFAVGWAAVALLGPWEVDPGIFSAGIFIATILLVNDLWWTSAWGYLPGAWSISAEAIHYALYVHLRRLSSTSIWIVFSCLVVLSTASGLIAYWATGGVYSGTQGAFWSWINTLAPWNTIPYFLLGVILVRTGFITRGVGRVGGQARAVALSLAIAGFAVTAFVGGLAPITLLFVAAVFLFALWSDSIPGKTWQWVGRRSYGTYFTHFVVLALVAALMPSEVTNVSPVVAAAAFVLFTCAVLGASSLLSQILWVTVERRGITWSRNWVSKSA